MRDTVWRLGSLVVGRSWLRRPAAGAVRSCFRLGSGCEGRRAVPGARAELCDCFGMSVVGYARVSTGRQSLDHQQDALTAAGCDRVFADKLSGVREDRPGLAALVDYVRAGDTVVVVALDRLGRSLSGVIRTVETLTAAGVLLRSLREGIDYGTATGRMLAGIFAALAGYERELMHERAAAAREAARLRGRHTGRPRRLSIDQMRQVRALRGGGESIADLVRSFGVSRATIYRALQTTELSSLDAPAGAPRDAPVEVPTGAVGVGS